MTSIVAIQNVPSMSKHAWPIEMLPILTYETRCTLKLFLLYTNKTNSLMTSCISLTVPIHVCKQLSSLALRLMTWREDLPCHE